MVRPELTAAAGRLLLAACGNRWGILMALVNGETKYLPERVAFQRGTYEAQDSNQATILANLGADPGHNVIGADHRLVTCRFMPE